MFKPGSIPKNEGGQIHLNPAAICMPTHHYEQQNVSSLLKLTIKFSQPALSMSSSTSSLILFSRHGHPLSSTPKYNNTVNKHCSIYIQLICSFLQTQHQQQVHSPLSFFELYSTHCSHHRSFCASGKFPSDLPSGTMFHFYTELQALHSSLIQPLSALDKICNLIAIHHTP